MSARPAEGAQASRKPAGPKRALSELERGRAREALAAVGMVLVRDSGQSKKPTQRGSAVIVRADGVIATCYHVIADERSGRLFDEIYFDLYKDALRGSAKSRRYRVEPVRLDRAFDLALLVIKDDDGEKSSESAFPALGLADSRKVQLLDSVIIIGYPASGLAGVTVNTGNVEGVDSLGNWIKTDARLIHGNSGGAAVNSKGKLIGIPTKVLVDKKVVDEDGDGFPDGEREYGAVGFLRPSHFVARMLDKLEEPRALRRKMNKSQDGGDDDDDDSPNRAMKVTKPKSAPAEPKATPGEPAATPGASLVGVRGLVRSEQDDNPVAGARVGLVRAGTTEVSAESLLAWGSANAGGEFELNRPVPPGKYTIVVRALGYAAHSLDVEIKQKGAPIVIRLRPSS
jgi:S1-C subfamily serine protease